jgi:hypothetical protein
MAVAGWLLLLLASIMHTWWSSQAKAETGQKAAGFFIWGPKPIYISVLLLVLGDALILFGTNVGWALAAIFIYFFILPLLSWPLLRLLGLAPALPEPSYREVESELEFQRIIAESAEDKLMRMEAVRDIERAYFVSKRSFPGKDEPFYLLLALKARCKGHSDEEVRALAARCTTLVDAIGEAVRLEGGGSLAKKVSAALESRPMCVNCGKYHALAGSICYGCLTSEPT